MYKRILIATDGSTLSDKAVESGLALAALSGATVVALKVIPRYPRSYFEGSAPLDRDAVKEIENRWSDAAQQDLAKIKDRGAADKTAVKCVVAKSDLIAESIITAATKNNCDLIVMASHGRKGIKRVLLGSETQHVLTHSHIPVLVLR
ncbi:universal stress protein [Diaphorobacter aerolatus]|uniref:Universal stress protein n=1 Tax=Diaphorobacter aerolatus TaxID=1288495 RepID=A0A7H0GJ42_9BURK|nr:universal stress protein [Diaphorobacter aerolatus]QNP48308.1 universal stress protein [Diaphorobacter aerolatus]